jgi:hypothetical protein
LFEHIRNGETVGNRVATHSSGSSYDIRSVEHELALSIEKQKHAPSILGFFSRCILEIFQHMHGSSGKARLFMAASFV